MWRIRPARDARQVEDARAPPGLGAAAAALHQAQGYEAADLALDYPSWAVQELAQRRVARPCVAAFLPRVAEQQGEEPELAISHPAVDDDLAGDLVGEAPVGVARRRGEGRIIVAVAADVRGREAGEGAGGAGCGRHEAIIDRGAGRCKTLTVSPEAPRPPLTPKTLGGSSTDSSLAAETVRGADS